MDFALSPQQQSLRDKVLAFARAEVGADAAEHDRAATFDREGWARCAEFGVLGWTVPTEYGGAGYDPVTAMVAHEAFAYGCRDNGLTFAINNHLWACVMYIVEHGTPQQCSQWLPPLVDGRLVGAHALTEPEAGSDILAMTTRAEKVGEDYVLTGTKCFISNGPVADLFTVIARTGDGPAQGALTLFLVPADLPGVHVVRDIPKAGLRGTLMGEIRFDGCVVPAANVLGAQGRGYHIFTSTIEWERSFMFSAAIGAMRRVLDMSVRHAMTRRQFGRPIGAFQAVSHKVADMRVRLEAARLMLYHVAWLKSQGRIALLECAMLKVFATESLVQTCLDAQQLHGARGYVSDLPIERELRDALAGTIYGGTSEIQRNVIASLVGLPATS